MLRVGIQWFLNQSGPAASAHLETGGFFRSGPGVQHPDIMAHFLPSQVQPIINVVFVYIKKREICWKGKLKEKESDRKEGKDRRCCLGDVILYM